MKTNRTRNMALALVGLLALSIYILACTSFSPDDTKVLYPAFDAASGAIGLGVYDREARHSEMLFVPIAYEGGQSNGVTGTFVRGQWLADGRTILVAWAGGKDSDESLNLAVVPWGAREPFKVFRVPGIKEVESIFSVPLCVAGGRLFIKSGPQEVLRVDLKTGAPAIHEFKDVKREISLYPAPDGVGVFYVESRDESDAGAVFGGLNPEDFSRTPMMVMTNETANESFIAYDKAGKQVAFLEKSGDPGRLVVLRDGRPSFTRSVGAEAEELAFGNAGFSPKGDWLWTTFQKKTEGKDTVSYGLMEIPLSDAPIRETILISSAPLEKDAAMYFQGALSHDGKAAAVASTYLACGDKTLKPEDCALFLIDLGNPNRKVTKVPIPVPAERPVFK